MTSDVPHARFRTLHALRIKGFATAEVVAEVAGLDRQTVDGALGELAGDDLATFREARALWQLTPAGREAHAAALAGVGGPGSPLATALAAPYTDFLKLNVRFKELCGRWQLRDGAPNDHTDAAYDRGVVEQLAAFHDEARPVLAAFAATADRFDPYARRLEVSCRRVLEGETTMFTGVMCGSYHDVWMELHEDLLLTQGIDRAAEGSF